MTPPSSSFDPRDGRVRTPRRGCAIPPRLLIALVIILIGVAGFYLKPKVHNPITDETHRVAMTVPDQIALGLQAAPEMMAQHGGEHPDQRLQAEIDRIGMKLVEANRVGDWAPEFEQYRWDFHLLRDPETVNAFALPGGQIFFTYGLYKFLKSEEEVAGVLGHEIGHVIAQHSAQQMAKQGLIQSVGTAVTVAASDGEAGSAQMGQMIHAVLSTKYSRGDETQADTLGVQFLMHAGYNPEGLVRVMQVLEEQAGGGGGAPEFLATHPSPGNRLEHIREVIAAARAGKLEGPKK